MSNQGQPTRLSAADSDAVDGAELLASLGIDEDEIAFRKSFTRFDDADAERLADLGSMFDGIADDMSDDFYDQIQSHDEANQFLDRSSKGVSQLKTLQKEYLRDLGRGEYDRSYFQQRARIGKLHDLLGLGPKIYFGAFSVYYEQLLDGIASRSTDEVLADHRTDDVDDRQLSEAVTATAEKMQARMQSVLKVLLLDQQVVMDTYIESYSQYEAELEQKQAVANDVDTSVNQLKTDMEAVSGSASDIDGIAEEQVDSMQSVAEETANLSATIEEVASTAADVDEKSTAAERLADEGQDAAERTREAMADVSETTERTVDQMSDLHADIQSVDEVVDVINDIADQTNLLALNASIEAARAGEDGDGFAVVADEVKSLAEQSKENAAEIETLVGDVQRNTRQVVDQLEATNEVVERGRGEVDEAVRTLTEITETVEETAQGIQEVADATEDQATSTEEVASMVDEVVADMEKIAREIDDITDVIDQQRDKAGEIEAAMDDLAED